MDALRLARSTMGPTTRRRPGLAALLPALSLSLPLALAISLPQAALAQPGDDMGGLQKLNIAGAGLVLVHPDISIGTYDSIRYRGVELRYKSENDTLSGKQEKQLRDSILERFKNSSDASETEVVEDPGECVVDIRLSVLNIDMKGESNDSPVRKNLGSATLAIDMRDSLSQERLVLLAGKRDFGAGKDRRGMRDDFKRLSESIGTLMVSLGQTLGMVVSEEIAGRGADTNDKPGCNARLREAAERAMAQQQEE